MINNYGTKKVEKANAKEANIGVALVQVVSRDSLTQNC